MRIDCHVHTRTTEEYCSVGRFNRERFFEDLKASFMDGAAIYSPSPLRYGDKPWQERMQIGLDICEGCDTLFPFYWIDPRDEDAIEQVRIAKERGYVAFKMIPYNYKIDSKKTLDVIEAISVVGMPIMFHSGICWDGLNSSANHRPMNYDALIEIPNLRFCLAHVSWPWYDECIAEYGKFVYNKRVKSNAPEMFIDVTPGTPPVYREEVFRHLLLSYNMRNNLMFGTDCNTDGYSAAQSTKWQNIDDPLYERFVEGDVEDFKEHIYGKNFLRFVGME